MGPNPYLSEKARAVHARDLLREAEQERLRRKLPLPAAAQSTATSLLRTAAGCKDFSIVTKLVKRTEDRSLRKGYRYSLRSDTPSTKLPERVVECAL